MSVVLDRIEPTRRPALPVRGYQRWRSLLFLHWAIPEESLRPFIPPQISLDVYDGVAYVGVVPFAMSGVRHSWWPERLSLEFLETNVRTYVHFNGRPGIYFLSLDAQSRLAVWGARLLWGLPYFHAAMTMSRQGDEITYKTERGKGVGVHKVRYRVEDRLEPSHVDTLEYFFLERYLLFVERGGEIYSGQVYHTPYPAHQVEVLEVDDGLVSASGLAHPDRLPDFAHYSPGVDVEIFPLVPVGEQEQIAAKTSSK